MKEFIALTGMALFSSIIFSIVIFKFTIHDSPTFAEFVEKNKLLSKIAKIKGLTFTLLYAISIPLWLFVLGYGGELAKLHRYYPGVLKSYFYFIAFVAFCFLVMPAVYKHKKDRPEK